MRTRQEILDEVVDAYDAGYPSRSDDSYSGGYSSEGDIHANWYKAITDNQKLILEVLLDIRDGVRPPSPAVLDAEAYKAP